MDQQLLERIRTLRAKHPEARATTIMAWARLPEHEPLPWRNDRRTGWARATIAHDGFDVEIRVRPDECGDLSWLGEFHERQVRGAIRVHAPNGYRADEHGCCWYVPANSYRDHRDSLLKMGFPRAEADRLARSYVKADADRLRRYCDGELSLLCVTLDVSRAGVRLGGASLHGIDVDDDRDPYLTEVAHDLIAEAIEDANNALARLCKH